MYINVIYKTGLKLGLAKCIFSLSINALYILQKHVDNERYKLSIKDNEQKSFLGNVFRSEHWELY